MVVIWARYERTHTHNAHWELSGSAARARLWLWARYDYETLCSKSNLPKCIWSGHENIEHENIGADVTTDQQGRRHREWGDMPPLFGDKKSKILKRCKFFQTFPAQVENSELEHSKSKPIYLSKEDTWMDIPYCVECRGIFRARQRNTDCSSGTVRDWLLIEGTRTFSAE